MEHIIVGSHAYKSNGYHVHHSDAFLIRNSAFDHLSVFAPAVQKSLCEVTIIRDVASFLFEKPIQQGAPIGLATPSNDKKCPGNVCSLGGICGCFGRRATGSSYRLASVTIISQSHCRT